MIAYYAQQTWQWWTDGIVRKVLGLLALSPVLIAGVWGYYHLLYWLCLALGMVSGGAVPVAGFMTLMTCVCIAAVVIYEATK